MARVLAGDLTLGDQLLHLLLEDMSHRYHEIKTQRLQKLEKDPPSPSEV
jgi:hypothetical protein